MTKETIIRILWDGPFVPKNMGGDKGNDRWVFLPHNAMAEAIPVDAIGNPAKTAEDVRREVLGKKYLSDATRDYGVYQIYGAHPLYGTDVLLYVGLAGESKKNVRCFADRLKEHAKVYGENITIYVGRLARLRGGKKATPGAWAKQIRLAEKMLIFSHSPAANAGDVASLFSGGATSRKLMREVIRVRNYGEFRSLKPEVSSDYWPDHATQRKLAKHWLFPYSTEE